MSLVGDDRRAVVGPEEWEVVASGPHVEVHVGVLFGDAAEELEVDDGVAVPGDEAHWINGALLRCDGGERIAG